MKLLKLLRNCGFVITVVLLSKVIVFSSEMDLINLSESFNRNGEYYSAITETMRYQHAYPKGRFFPRSMLVMGEAYFKGGNYEKALSTLEACFEKFKDKPEGENAFYGKGYVHLAIGESVPGGEGVIRNTGTYTVTAFWVKIFPAIYASGLTLMNDLGGAKNGDKRIRGELR